jgi:hypothetical protein
MLLLATAVVLGFVAASAQAGSTLTAAALMVLGVGWSASVISASALLASTASDRVRIPLQGATDASMNYAGAIAAALAGPILASGGFQAVNVAATIILVPAVAAGVAALRGRDAAAGVEPPTEAVLAAPLRGGTGGRVEPVLGPRSDR